MSEDLRQVYGTCQREPCSCRTVLWLGTDCPHWKPMGPRTQEELAMWHRAASTRPAAAGKQEAT